MSTTELVGKLSKFLADSYTLYLKTQNFHWNVTGPLFHAMHTMFEEQYNDLALAVDEIAERIRALGAVAPGSYSQFAKLTSIKEASESVPKAMEMVQLLEADHKALSKQAHDIIAVAAELTDDVTVDLCTGRMSVHEKTAWMLRAVSE